MKAKLGLVAVLIGYHCYCWWYMKALRKDAQFRSHKFFRVYNELPVLLLVAIVILIVVKPTL
jgi:putative membrane protein